MTLFNIKVNDDDDEIKTLLNKALTIENDTLSDFECSNFNQVNETYFKILSDIVLNFSDCVGAARNHKLEVLSNNSTNETLINGCNTLSEGVKKNSQILVNSPILKLEKMSSSNSFGMAQDSGMENAIGTKRSSQTSLVAEDIINKNENSLIPDKKLKLDTRQYFRSASRARHFDSMTIELDTTKTTSVQKSLVEKPLYTGSSIKLNLAENINITVDTENSAGNRMAIGKVHYFVDDCYEFCDCRLNEKYGKESQFHNGINKLNSSSRSVTATVNTGHDYSIIEAQRQLENQEIHAGNEILTATCNTNEFSDSNNQQNCVINTESDVQNYKQSFLTYRCNQKLLSKNDSVAITHLDEPRPKCIPSEYNLEEFFTKLVLVTNNLKTISLSDTELSTMKNVVGNADNDNAIPCDIKVPKISCNNNDISSFSTNVEYTKDKNGNVPELISEETTDSDLSQSITISEISNSGEDSEIYETVDNCFIVYDNIIRNESFEVPSLSSSLDGVSKLLKRKSCALTESSEKSLIITNEESPIESTLSIVEIIDKEKQSFSHVTSVESLESHCDIEWPTDCLENFVSACASTSVTENLGNQLSFDTCGKPVENGSQFPVIKKKVSCNDFDTNSLESEHNSATLESLEVQNNISPIKYINFLNHHVKDISVIPKTSCARSSDVFVISQNKTQQATICKKFSEVDKNISGLKETVFINKTDSQHVTGNYLVGNCLQLESVGNTKCSTGFVYSCIKNEDVLISHSELKSFNGSDVFKPAEFSFDQTETEEALKLASKPVETNYAALSGLENQNDILQFCDSLTEEFGEGSKLVETNCVASERNRMVSSVSEKKKDVLEYCDSLTGDFGEGSKLVETNSVASETNRVASPVLEKVNGNITCSTGFVYSYINNEDVQISELELKSFHCSDEFKPAEFIFGQTETEEALDLASKLVETNSEASSVLENENDILEFCDSLTEGFGEVSKLAEINCASSETNPVASTVVEKENDVLKFCDSLTEEFGEASKLAETNRVASPVLEKENCYTTGSTGFDYSYRNNDDVCISEPVLKSFKGSDVFKPAVFIFGQAETEEALTLASKHVDTNCAASSVLENENDRLVFCDSLTEDFGEASKLAETNCVVSSVLEKENDVLKFCDSLTCTDVAEFPVSSKKLLVASQMPLVNQLHSCDLEADNSYKPTEGVSVSHVIGAKERQDEDLATTEIKHLNSLYDINDVNLPRRTDEFNIDPKTNVLTTENEQFTYNHDSTVAKEPTTNCNLKFNYTSAMNLNTLNSKIVDGPLSSDTKRGFECLSNVGNVDISQVNCPEQTLRQDTNLPLNSLKELHTKNFKDDKNKYAVISTAKTLTKPLQSLTSNTNVLKNGRKTKRTSTITSANQQSSLPVDTRSTLSNFTNKENNTQTQKRPATESPKYHNQSKKYKFEVDKPKLGYEFSHSKQPGYDFSNYKDAQEVSDNNDPRWATYNLNTAEACFEAVCNQWGFDRLPNPHRDLTQRYHNRPIIDRQFKIPLQNNNINCLSVYDQEIDKIAFEINRLNRELQANRPFWNKGAVLNTERKIGELRDEQRKVRCAWKEAQRFYDPLYNRQTGWDAKLVGIEKIREAENVRSIIESNFQFYGHF